VGSAAPEKGALAHILFRTLPGVPRVKTLFIFDLGEEQQEFHESGLLLQNGKYLVPDYLYKLLFLFQLRDEFNNTAT